MRSFALWTAVAGSMAMSGVVGAQTWEAPGSLVGVSVEVGGRQAPLYAAADASGRWYLEARAGSRYAIRLANRSGQRLGVLVAVDGLNVVSGELAPDLSRRPAGLAGRMYVLDAWDETTIQGWRTSLDEVRRFTFVDERSSYALRSGKGNSKLGWIEVAVFRERRPWAWQRPWEGVSGPREEPEGKLRDKREGDGYQAPEPATEDEAGGRADSAERKARPSAPSAGLGSSARSYPGTGWGSRTDDHAVVVDFPPEPTPSERHTLRYEYRKALYALGVLPRPRPYRDRLVERDRGEGGFAAPPAW
jgi:hypothetical protein